VTAKERTVLLRPPGPVESLDSLEEEARRFALHCLRTSGRLAATLLLVTEKGLVAFVPNSMRDEQAKDQFANECRLVAIATQARMCAMVMETWVASVLPGDDPIAKVPSEEPDRMEAVMIVLEAHREQQRTYVQPVIRDRKGDVAKLTKSIVPTDIQLGGRFAGVLPAIWPSDEETKAAAFLVNALNR
jgi:hypothetical protein